MVETRIIPTKFQDNNVTLEIFPLSNKIPIIGVVIPARMSKFIPSKVINVGTIPSKYRFSKVTSTGQITPKGMIWIRFLFTLGDNIR